MEKEIGFVDSVVLDVYKNTRRLLLMHVEKKPPSKKERERTKMKTKTRRQQGKMIRHFKVDAIEY